MRAPVATILLLVLAGLLYAPMMGCFIDAPNSDAFGRGLAQAYGAILAGMLWLVLAALLIIAAVKGRMPLWARVGAVVLWPLSCIAVWMAADAHAAGDRSAIWVPVLLPPLIALYALWARLPALHVTFRAGLTSIVLGGAIAFLSLAPLVAAHRAALPDPARDARLAELAKAEEERMAKERQAAYDREEGQFASLGPDSPLEAYLIYLSSMAYGERALAGVRQVKNRQADAILLLRQGRLLDLRQLWQFDVAPTGRALPSLRCGACRRRRQSDEGTVGLSHDGHRARIAAAQPDMVDRQALRPRPVPRPAGKQPARRGRFLPCDPVRRYAGRASPGQVRSIVPLNIGTQRPPI
jgi:hypothetical protein